MPEGTDALRTKSTGDGQHPAKLAILIYTKEPPSGCRGESPRDVPSVETEIILGYVSGCGMRFESVRQSGAGGLE